ncbi:MAG: hypothetical protein A3K19_24025 [Lentisphaerae bacterium RIFOXYB12_FULL_65_16]|nr:MAG: hypothetical protein A3K18_10260 [Lentisphaerae bacterium RIFOXYA12_64_32]OGV89585.1 MAG: hypothetical protein A3K19_24025 [Lentisphaerae bacterium RIFOXYB12_FULL_65_16]
MKTVLLSALVAPMALAAEPAMLPRDWAEPIPLEHCVVVTDSTVLGTRVVEALRARNADATVMTARQAVNDTRLAWHDTRRGATVIVIGGIHDNAAVLPLYAQYLSYGDLAYPGGDGTVIRTVNRPFGEGTAAITLEASSPAGEERVVARFTERLSGLEAPALPTIIEAALSEERAATANALGPNERRYALTGKPDDAATALKSLLGESGEGQLWGHGSDYSLEAVVLRYALIQDAPGVAPQDVLMLDNALLRTLVATQNEYWRRRDGSRIGGRHQIMGTSSFLAGVDLLLRRGNPNAEARALLERWRDECRAYWRNACSTFNHDLAGVPTLYCPDANLDWALKLGCDEYIRMHLRQAALRLITVTDSLGCCAGDGTYEECRPGMLYKQTPSGWLLRAANAFCPGQGFDWFLDEFARVGTGNWAVDRNFGGARTFAVGGETRRPDHLLGVTVVPLGDYRYERIAHDRDSANGGRYLIAPRERAYEKLCFRDGFDVDSQYLCLQGYADPGADNVLPDDVNSIVRYTDLGHVWLHANCPKSGNLNRTAVFCTDGVNDGPHPTGCDLIALAQTERVALVSSRLPDYHGGEWTRHLLWTRGRYLVVIDAVEQTGEGGYGLVCTFRTPQYATLTADGMLAREGRAEFRIRNADAAKLALEIERDDRGAAIPHLLRQTQQLDAERGSSKVFRNLLYATDPEHPGELELRPVGANAALVRGTIRGHDELTLVAVRLGGPELQVGPFASDAVAIQIGRDGWLRSGGTRLRFGDATVTEASGATTPAMSAALETLWSTAAAPTRPIAPAPAVETRPLWSAAGFARVPNPIAAPLLSAEPTPTGRLNALLDGIVPVSPDCVWPQKQPVTLTLDLRQPHRIERLDLRRGQFGPRNAVPSAEQLPAPRVVQVALDDAPEQPLVFKADVTFEDLHKGSVYPVLRWCLDSLGQTAQRVRLRFEPDVWSDGLALSEVIVRGGGDGCTKLQGHCLADIDGDGRAELLLWSDEGEIVAIRADGGEALRVKLGGSVTAVACFTELADTPRLIATTREALAYCLRPDGAKVWRADLLPSAKINGDHPTAYSIGLVRNAAREPVLVLGNYHLVTFLSAAGETLKYVPGGSAYHTMTMNRGGDFDGDGVEETVTAGIWGGAGFFSGACERTGWIGIPVGRGILLERWPAPDNQPKAVCGTEDGVTLIDLATKKVEWNRPLRPLNDAAIVTSDTGPRLALAKADGYLMLLDSAGAVVASRWIGEPVRAVTSTATGVIVAALADRLTAYDPALTTERTLAAGTYDALAVMPGGPLVGLRAGGRVDAWPAP